MQFNIEKIDLKIVCVENDINIKKGEIYTAKYFYSDYVHIVNNAGDWDFYPYSKFISLDEYREKIINKILSQN